MRFLFALFYSLIVTLLVILVIAFVDNQITDMMSFFGFYIIYVGLFGSLGCMIGEVVYFLLSKLKKRIVVIEYFIYLILGLMLGITLEITSTVFEDHLIIFLTVIGAISFYVSRNFVKQEWIR
ncbi:hypothetical protein PASE110613_00120 [Paenibacillus sediminis]|uniref:Tellurium resistance membrane protein TerC n=1 Tax=Paenibacillus sediminis TaxID=664909 RepID=A0ABS4H0G0_9BACL|nr:putative tellurium resistance membrane protein TerC [Paenibacillus sediminis]